MDPIPAPMRVWRFLVLAMAAGWLWREIPPPEGSERAWIIYPPRDMWWRDRFLIKWVYGPSGGSITTQISAPLRGSVRTVHQLRVLTTLKGIPRG